MAAGLATSKADARRGLEAGGFSVNGERAGTDRALHGSDLLPGGYIVLQKGKKSYAMVSHPVGRHSNREGDMLKEFMAFVKEYGVIGLAIAVILGGKLNALVTAVVDGLLMPIIGLIPVGGSWQTWAIPVGAQQIQVGTILAALVNFLIVAWLVFWFAKKVLREETVKKK